MRRWFILSLGSLSKAQLMNSLRVSGFPVLVSAYVPGTRNSSRVFLPVGSLEIVSLGRQTHTAWSNCATIASPERRPGDDDAPTTDPTGRKSCSERTMSSERLLSPARYSMTSQGCRSAWESGVSSIGRMFEFTGRVTVGVITTAPLPDNACWRYPIQRDATSRTATAFPQAGFLFRKVMAIPGDSFPSDRR